jgi:hypothetical protein
MAATTTTKATAQLYGASPGTPPKTPASWLGEGCPAEGAGQDPNQ